MKSVGFVDFYLDEWHANNYPDMIRAYAQASGQEYRLTHAWAELSTPPSGGRTTEQWCRDFGVTPCQSIEQLCASCDHVIVLSPSNPEKHLAYAKEVFHCGKHPYIDKTFALSVSQAEEIFDAATACGVRFFSSSALRYATELAPFKSGARTVTTTGGGSNLPEYIIHQLEMIVSTLGTGATQVLYTKHADQVCVDIAYADGRHGKLFYAPALPFTATVSTDGESSSYHVIESPFFDHLIADIFRFFETDEVSFDTAETMEIMRLREVILAAAGEPDVWHEI